MDIRLRPIGFLHNQFESRIPEGWETALAQIAVEERWHPALEGIEAFSHLIVLFWLDRSPRRHIEKRIHPENREDLPAVGLFATRTPYRPNPIGLQVVELVRREGNVLTIRGIDALDGTPVLDIKPYLQRGDRIARTRIPIWLKKLWAEAESTRPKTESAGGGG